MIKKKKEILNEGDEQKVANNQEKKEETKRQKLRDKELTLVFANYFCNKISFRGRNQ